MNKMKLMFLVLSALSQNAFALTDGVYLGNTGSGLEKKVLRAVVTDSGSTLEVYQQFPAIKQFPATYKVSIEGSVVGAFDYGRLEEVEPQTGFRLSRLTSYESEVSKAIKFRVRNVQGQSIEFVHSSH